MKDIKNINLGGYPFAINYDAYEALEDYIESIEDHFKNSDGFEEIVTDIEHRMAELLKEKLDGKLILNMPVVEEAIATLGLPEEFEGQDSNFKKRKSELNFGKRLMRDSSDQVVSGVASGLAAYFGIPDPVWVRIGFAILFFGAGIGILPYVILWIVMPEAKTASDRLAMRGEDINIDSIAKEIEEGFDQFTDKVSELADKISKKKMNKDFWS